MSEAAPPPKKKESWRGVVVVAVLCGTFLWWWFSLSPAPEPMGAEGLVEAGLAEIAEFSPQRPLLVEFDLLELSMVYLRAGEFDAARRVAGKIGEDTLQARAIRAIAEAYLNKDSGSMAPALKICQEVRHPALREKTAQHIILELARMGFGDIALEQAKADPALRLKIYRILAETDAKDQARAALPGVLGEIAALPPDKQAASREDAVWVKLWLGDHDEVISLTTVADFPPTARREILQELFRMKHLEGTPAPAETLRWLEKMPPELRLDMRLDAARLGGGLEPNEALLAEFSRLAESASTPAAQAEGWIRAATACWQISAGSDESWRPLAQKAEALLKNLPPEQWIPHTCALAGLYYDALDLQAGREALQRAKDAAVGIPDKSIRSRLLGKILQQWFRSSEPEAFRATLVELRQLWQTAPPTLEAAQEAALLLFKEGAWHDAVALAERFSNPERATILSALADLPVHASASFGNEISQDETLKEVRQVAIGQGEVEAMKLLLRREKSVARGRGWLEIAKGIVFGTSLKNSPAEQSPLPVEETTLLNDESSTPPQ